MNLSTMAVVALIAPLANSFVVSSTFHPNTALASRQWLDAVDEMCVENAASYCLEEQCDVEDKLALMNQLQDQRELMSEKVVAIDNLVERLKQDTTKVTEKDKETMTNLLEQLW